LTEPDSEFTSTNPLARVPRWLWLSLAVLIAIRMGLPIALEKAIPWFAKRETGVDVEIANVDIGMFGGTLVFEGLRVANSTHSEGSDPGLLSLARLQLEIDWLALLGAHLSLPLVQLDGLTLRLHQNRDGSFALPTPAPAKIEGRPEITPSLDPSEHVQASEIPAAQGASKQEASEAVETGEVKDEADGWRFSVEHFELNQPDLALHSERAGGEVASFTATRFAVNELTSGPAGFGLGDISLEEPEVFVERDWLFDPGVGGDGEATLEDETRAPSLRVDRLAMGSGRFLIRSPDGPIESAVRIEILRFDTAPGRTFPIEVALDVGDGSISLKGQLGIVPPSYEGELAWRGLRVPPYLLLTTPAVVPWLASCNAEGRLDVSFRSQEPAGLVLRGETHFSDLVFRHPETGELALEAQQMSIQVREASYPLEAGQPRRVDVALLEISKPKVVFTNPPDALDDLLAIYTEPPLPEQATADEPAPGDPETATGIASEPATPEPTAGPAMTIDVEKLKLSDGELVFVDRTVTPRHETRIRNFRLDAAGVTSSPGGAEQVEMTGLIHEKGSLEVKGKLPGGKGSLRFEVRRLDLASYNGFARGAGLNLDSGDASLESAIRILDGRYESDNDLVLHDLRVDATEPGAFSSTFGVSIDFALALLRGPSGDIELAMPVSFDKTGVGVGMGSLIRSALKEAFTGALTSPFKLVGGLLPTGSKSASGDAIAFEPGAIELAATAEKRIVPLIDLLEDRPGLGLTVRGQTAPADEPSLAYAVLRDLAVEGEGLPEREGVGFFARRRLSSALRERASGGAGALEPADEALLSRYVETQDVPIERYEALANARAQSVVDALISAGARADSLTVGAPARAHTPAVVIDLGLRARDGPGNSE
jgi:hypothetical protein